MSHLNSTTRLQRIPKLDIQLKANNTVRLKWGKKELNAGMHTLAILNTFHKPQTVPAALNHMAQMEDVDEIVLINMITELFDAGVLQDVDAIRTNANPTIRFGNPSIHIAMLNDRTRTAKYLKAIREVVRPGDIVIDLGTGTGVLALAAAKAGAAHVYAIEANPRIAEVAKANFTRNRVADRVTICHGRSTDVTLPQRADVLISEIIGNDPFDEQIVEITADARRRLLKPDARMIPSSMTLFGLPVTIPAVEYDKFVFSTQAAANWYKWYDIDLTALTEIQHPNYEPLFHINPQKARAWTQLSEPLQLANVNLCQFHDPRVDYSETIIAHTAGLLNGLLIYFEVELSPQTWLSTHPDKAGQDNHWRSPVWGTLPAFDVECGESFVVQYETDSMHRWTFAHMFRRTASLRDELFGEVDLEAATFADLNGITAVLV